MCDRRLYSRHSVLRVTYCRARLRVSCIHSHTDQAPVLRLTPTRYRLLFWICAVSVLVLSLLPPSVPQPSTGWDKSNHFLAFGVLALLGVRAWAGKLPAVLAALMVYGVLIEWLQGMTPNRTSDWHDLIADAIGLALGLVLHAALLRVWPGLSIRPDERRP